MDIYTEGRPMEDQWEYINLQMIRNDSPRTKLVY